MDEQTALKLITEDYDGSDYTAVVEGVDDGHHKHDSTYYYSVYQRKSDNTFWKVNFSCSYNYGLDEYSVYICEVEKKEVLTVKWVRKSGDKQ